MSNNQPKPTGPAIPAKLKPINHTAAKPTFNNMPKIPKIMFPLSIVITL